ncbi:MAG: (Fe-S)-binding protein [Clostridiales bacterium]|nr:(Fe-S)-binding protein [Candidatus Crickella merdequi]
MMISVEKCVHCHLCQDKCDFLSKYGIDIGDTEKLKEFAYHCFLCGKCTEVCPVGIDGRGYILDLRRAFAQSNPAAVKRAYKGVFKEKQNYSFRNWSKVTPGSVFFPGCNFPSLFPKTNAEISRVLAEHGIGTIYDCCGKPIAELGDRESEDIIIEDIAKRLRDSGVEEIILACPNCRGHFGDRLGIKVTSIFTKLSELGLGNIIEDDVKFFVPCPDREKRAWIDEIRPFVKGEISFVEGVQCCGLGGCAISKEPEISKAFADKFKDEADGEVMAYCASCTGRLKRNGFDSINHIITVVMGTGENPDTKKSYVNRVLTKFK